MLLTDENLKAQILTVLADNYSRRIIMSTMGEPKSAMEISRLCDIPLTTAYRRIRDLIGVGLLEVTQSGRTPDGHWYELYRSMIRKVDVRFREGALEVDVDLREDKVDKLTRVWSELKKRQALEHS